MKRRQVNAAEELAASRSSGGRRTSATKRTAPPLDLGVRLADLPRGEGQVVRMRWRTITRDDDTKIGFVELRLWTRGPGNDGRVAWYPSKKSIRLRVDELVDVADGFDRALELASDFLEGPGAA